MKRRIKFFLLITVLGLGIYFFSQKGAELSQLQKVAFPQLAMALAAILFTQWITGLKLRQMLLSQKVRLTPSEWFGLPNIRKLGNLLFFKSGTVSNAYYLKSKRDLSYSKFVVIFTVEKITSLYANTLMGLAISFFFFVNHEIIFHVVLFFILILAGLTYFLFFFSFKTKAFETPLLQKVSRLLDIWNEFSSNRSAVFSLIALEILAIHSIGLRFFVAFNILNQPVQFFECIIMAIAAALAGVVNLVPGSLGIREGAVGLTAQYLGRRFDFGVIATTFDRILATLSFGVLGYIFFHVLSFERFEKDPEILSELKEAPHPAPKQ